MKIRKIKVIACLLLLIYIMSQASAIIISAESEARTESSNSTDAVECGFNVSSRILELFTGSGADKEKKVLVGGGVFGIRLNEIGITVAEAPLGSALSSGDRIISINGSEVNSPSDIEDLLHGCGGKPLWFEIIRSGERIKLSITPKLQDGKYRLGISLRKSTSGLGTITFIDPETGVFGGLGHGISSPDGRVFGKMGHSERVDASLYRNVVGDYDIKMFKSMVKFFK